MRVQRHFVIPSTTAWPYDMHGVELGRLVEKIRGRKGMKGGLKKFRPYRDELERMGVDFEKREVGDWEKVCDVGFVWLVFVSLYSYKP